MPERTTLPGGQIGVQIDRQVLGLQQLKLQRHDQPVLRARGRSRIRHSPPSSMARQASACRP